MQELADVAQLVNVIAHAQRKYASRRHDSASRVARNEHQRAVVAPHASICSWVGPKIRVEDEQLIDRLPGEDLADHKSSTVSALGKRDFDRVARAIAALRCTRKQGQGGTSW